MTETIKYNTKYKILDTFLYNQQTIQSRGKGLLKYMNESECAGVGIRSKSLGSNDFKRLSNYPFNDIILQWIGLMKFICSTHENSINMTAIMISSLWADVSDAALFIIIIREIIDLLWFVE